MYLVIDLAQKRELASFDVVEGAINYIAALVSYFGLEKLPTYTITEKIRDNGSFEHLFNYQEFEAQVKPLYSEVVRDRVVKRKQNYALLV
jgi:hypothetical protein